MLGFRALHNTSNLQKRFPLRNTDFVQPNLSMDGRSFGGVDRARERERKRESRRERDVESETVIEREREG